MDELTFLRFTRADNDELIGINLAEVSTYAGKKGGRTTRIEMKNGSSFPITWGVERFESLLANVVAP